MRRAADQVYSQRAATIFLVVRPSGYPYHRIIVDTRTPEQRRRIMQAVKTAGTGPERAVRRSLRALGYGYRLNARDLPGKPDIVFRGRRKVVFVHGCYWHGHGCAKGRLPKSHLEYWQPKIRANVERDARHAAELRRDGWSVLTIWQCEIRDETALTARLKAFMEAGAKRGSETRKERAGRERREARRFAHRPRTVVRGR